MKKFIIALLLFCSTPAIATQTGEEFTRPLGHDLKYGFGYSYSEIRRKYGETAVKETGDAADAVSRVCYFTSDNSAVFEFYQTEVSQGFTFRLPDPQDRMNCSPSKRLSSKDLNVNGVKLGLKREAYESLIGHTSTSPGITVDCNPTSISHDFSLTKFYTGAEVAAILNHSRSKTVFQVSDREDGYLDSNISLHAYFSEARLIKFDVSYTAEY